MQFSTTLVSLLAAVFAPVVLANIHDACTCKNGDSLIPRMAVAACENYAQQGYDHSNVVYDTATQLCTRGTDSDYLMGKEWQAACQAVAQSGYACADGQGTCFADPDNVRGSC